MTWEECKQLIREDLGRSCDSCSKRMAFRYLLTNASFKMTFWFRIGNYLSSNNSGFLLLVVRIHYKRLMYRTGIQLPIGTQVGGGLQFKHFNGIVVNDGAVIGKNATIYNGVTIGENLKPGASGHNPVIDDNVVICTGAKVIGRIRIGRNSIIGANAVVTKDIPEDSVVAGIPARVIKSGGGEYVSAYLKHH